VAFNDQAQLDTMRCLIIIQKYTIFNAGGAWAIPESLWVRSQEGVLRAANAGFGILEAGGSAVDAVVGAVSLLSCAVLPECSQKYSFSRLTQSKI